MTKQWHAVTFNGSFSRQATEFWKEAGIKPIRLREETYLARIEEKTLTGKKYLPFLINTTELKKFTSPSNAEKFLLKQSKKETEYALRIWTTQPGKKSGRDWEVEIGKRLFKKGMNTNPKNTKNIWFMIFHGKNIYSTPHALPEEAHPFAPMDFRITENGFVTRSGQKLRFLLHQFGFDPKGKIGVDIGSGTGGWTQHLIQKGANHIYAIDKTVLDKKLQKNKKITYIAQKSEEAPKLNQKPDFIVMDINVNPAHAMKIFTQFDKKNPGAKTAIITQKILRGSDLNHMPKEGEKKGKWTAKKVTNSWFARRECYLLMERKEERKQQKTK